PPFRGDSFLAVAMQHVNEPAPSVALARTDVPLRLDAALRRAMANDPVDRLPSREAFVQELDACLATLGEPDADRTVIAAPPVAVRRAPARRRRRWAPWLALFLGVLLIAGGVGLYLLVRDTDDGGGGGGGGGGPAQVHL